VNTPDFTVSQRVLSSRWMIQILESLDVPKRFGDIQNVLSGLSRGVLAAQLQELLQMGLLHQEKYTCFPPRVEYSLTVKGQGLLQILEQLNTV
jgi:DNA-binding HxlR family transcriptional regulator